jgi:hypothetical protein
VSEIAKKFYEWCEGKKPESNSGEAQKQVQVDGVAHNRREQKKQADFKEAGRTSSVSRNEHVTGSLGRVELTEVTPDGKIITHVRGVPAPAQEAQATKLPAESSTDAEPRKTRIGATEYGADQVVAQDLGKMFKKGMDFVTQSAANPELLKTEKPPDGGDWRYPHRGREDEFVDYDSCAKANKAFPEMAKYLGDAPGRIDPNLIAATIRNEQFYYVNLKDPGPDHYVKTHGNWPFGQDKSIGPAQMQVENIRKLAKKFPGVLGPESEALSNAIKLERAPYFVGAYFADVINGIEYHQKPDYITASTWKSVNEHWQKGEKNEALIFAYNPDLNQVNHIFTQLDAIKAPDWD